MKNTECPLYPDMQAIQQSSESLAKSIRRLRRKLNTCKACNNFEECQVMAKFSQAVQAAIQEISDEWNLESLFS